MEATEKLEFQLASFIEEKANRDAAVMRMEFLKEKIYEKLKEMDETTVVIPFDDTHNIKATIVHRNNKRLDKEKMADDLRVEESVINNDFLLKAIEDRRLTFEEYKDYKVFESNESASIRLAKVEKKKGQKND